jgi:hypothetical protein
MGHEYKIKFNVPKGYDPSALFKKLPSPIQSNLTREIYNYAIEKDGFYFIDHLVNHQVASVALRLFIDEALLHSETVMLLEP